MGSTTKVVRHGLRSDVFRQAVASMALAIALAAHPGAPSAGPAAPGSDSAVVATHTRPPVPGRHARDAVATQQRIEHCQSRGPQVWLTFDDGGSAAQVDRILRILARQHVQAIFFPIGSWAEANAAVLRHIARAGQLIGDHTHDHVDLQTAPDGRAEWQIRHGVTATAGTVPLLRPPFGAGAYTSRLDALAEQSGLQLCTWTVDTRDWTGASAATIVRRVAHGDRMTPPVRAGGVVIMHMNGDHTGRALPGVIRAVRARGLRLRPLPH